MYYVKKKKKCIITFNQKPWCKCSLKIIHFFIYMGALMVVTMVTTVDQKGKKKGLNTCFKFEYRSDIEIQQTKKIHPGKKEMKKK